MDVDVGIRRLDLVEDRRQLLVVDQDELCGLVGDMGVARQHDGDRLADIAHLADRQDRLVVEGRPEIGIGDQLADVLGGVDAVDARHVECRACVDPGDPSMRDRAAHDLRVQHARQADIVGVFGAAGHLGGGFEARDGATDLAVRHEFRHEFEPPWSADATALARARATFTRMSCVL